jgi:hypothetical protein
MVEVEVYWNHSGQIFSHFGLDELIIVPVPVAINRYLPSINYTASLHGLEYAHIESL